MKSTFDVHRLEKNHRKLHASNELCSCSFTKLFPTAQMFNKFSSWKQKLKFPCELNFEKVLKTTIVLMENFSFVATRTSLLNFWLNWSFKVSTKNIFKWIWSYIFQFSSLFFCFTSTNWHAISIVLSYITRFHLVSNARHLSKEKKLRTKSSFFFAKSFGFKLENMNKRNHTFISVRRWELSSQAFLTLSHAITFFYSSKHNESWRWNSPSQLRVKGTFRMHERKLTKLLTSAACSTCM